MQFRFKDTMTSHPKEPSVEGLHQQSKKHFRAAVKRANVMRKADGKTVVTCPASRHAQMIAELMGRRSFAMVHDEPEHCAESILSAVGSLYEARLMIARGVKFTEGEVDALLRAADYLSIDGDAMPAENAQYLAAVLRSLAISHGSSPAASPTHERAGGRVEEAPDLSEILSGETMTQREEVCAAWADLPDDLRKDERLTRLYHALGGPRMDDPTEAALPQEASEQKGGA